MADKEANIFGQAVRFVLDIANGRHVLSEAIPPLLLVLDAILCCLVIWKIPYTEIDWVAYMEHIDQYVHGERDYTKFEGGTGPLVYPAAHVYIYTGLYYLTNKGKDIFLAQELFGGLYLITLALVMACYWKAKAPPYIFPLLILSKRLHSIFVLRCFNDCFAVFFLWAAIYLLQRRSWALGTLVYTWGLGVKMTLLLVLPAFGIVLFLGRGFVSALRLASLIGQSQVAIAIPFIMNNPWGYLSRAFEFSRQFFYKWTVNWRFVSEEVFLSRPFSISLLVLHVSVLMGFIMTRWLKPTGKSLGDIVTAVLNRRLPFSDQAELIISLSTGPQYILTTILTSNVIGLLFARSLHYQFYAYLAWATPFLLWRSGVHPILQYVLWGLQEWAWNVYPSTPLSSGVVVGVMAMTVGFVWLGVKEEPDRALQSTRAGTTRR